MDPTRRTPVKILVADDSPVSRTLITGTLSSLGHQLVVVEDGAAAASAFEADDAPQLAVLDWEMPALTGPEVCQRIRSRARAVAPYLILLTSRESKDDVVIALEAGADDYLTKPFHREELRSRVRVGERMLDLQRHLADRVTELERALAKVRQLEGMLPICSYCKKVRDDQNYWHQVEAYVEARSDAQFSHGVCPDCYEKHLKPYLDG